MKSKHIILGLIGQPSGGKDTVADYIVKKYELVHMYTEICSESTLPNIIWAKQ